MKSVTQPKLLLACVLWVSGCITLSGLLIAAAAFSASVTDWSGDSKFWYCLTDWCVNGSQTLNAFPLWVFILAQFIAAAALFVSAYRDHKKQA